MVQAAPSRTLTVCSATEPVVQARASSARSLSNDGSTACVSGSPKRQLYSIEARAVGSQHQPGVQHTDVGRSGRREVVDDRLHERAQQVVGLVRHRGGRERAHPAGVRTGVTLADPLVVLGERQGDRCGAVAQREHRALGADELLLEYERPQDRGGPDRRLGLGVVGGYHDPLACREPIELDHDRSVELSPPSQTRSRRRSPRSVRTPAREPRATWRGAGCNPSTIRCGPAWTWDRSTGSCGRHIRRRCLRPGRTPDRE